MSLEERLTDLTHAIMSLENTIKGNQSSGSCATAPAVEVPVSKPKRKRRTKAEIAAEKTAEEEAVDVLADAEVETPVEELPDEQPVEVVTEDAMRASAGKLVAASGAGNKDGLNHAKKIISEMGFANLGEVTEDKYAELKSKFDLAVSTWK